MINAEVTAENKPACVTGQHAFTKTPCGTHEDQGGVQVLVMFLEELLVVLFCHFTVVLVELIPVILLSGDCVLLRAAQVSDVQARGRENTFPPVA